MAKKAASKKPAGRPSKYTDDLAKQICTLVAEGNSLRKIIEMDGMPSRQTVYQWMDDVEGFSDQYAKAREEQADWHFDNLMEIADNPDLDPAHKRIMVDTRKWAASKLKSKAYGEKIEQQISGKDGGPIVLWGGKDAD